MNEFVAIITSKGQLTLPAAERRQLGIDPGDRVAIVIEDENGARLRRIDHDVASVRGLIPTPPELVGRDVDDLIEEAMTDHADALIHRMRQGNQ